MRSSNNLRLVSMACSSFLFSLAVNPAKAAVVLMLDDLSTAGIDKILSDDQLVGYLTSVGATTTVDSFSGIGYLTYIGSVGNFNVNLTTGVSKPAIRSGMLDINSINVSGGAGAVTPGNPYSLTIFADIVHTAAGQLTDFDAEVAPVPLPVAAWLIGSGIVGMTFTARRKTV